MLHSCGKRWLWSALIALMAGCSRAETVNETVGGDSSSLTAEQSTLGFEALGDWTLSSGSNSLSTRYVEGTSSLAVTAGGSITLTSRTLSSIGSVGDVIGVDLALPVSQPNPSWFGAVQLYVTLPSKGLLNRYIGQVELTGKSLGVFNRLELPLPAAVATALRGTYTDLTFKIALNVPNGPRTYLFDRLATNHFVNPPVATPPQQLGTLSFENPTAWTITNGTGSGSSDSVQGKSSLRVAPRGYTTIKSPALASLGAIADTISVFIKLPIRQVNPSWYGDLQLFYDLPSKDKFNVPLGLKSLTGLPLGQFVLVKFTLSAADAAVLRQNYTDLRLSFALNVPAGSDPYLMDYVYADTPETQAFQGCVTVCEKLATFNCSATPSAYDCVQGCRIGILHGGCQAEWRDLMNCHTAQFATGECDDITGEPVFPACSTKLSTYRSCLGSNPL